MSIPQPLVWASVAGASIVAVASLFVGRRDRTTYIFFASLAFLFLERLCQALAQRATALPAIQTWQEYRLCALAALSCTWVWFSFLFARDQTPPLIRQRATLPLVLVGLAGLLYLTHGSLLADARAVEDSALPLVRLGWAGVVLHILVLVGAVLTLLNLERTYRAAIGTMRWRIKFMLLGVAVMAGGVFYTASQVLLFRAIDSRLDAANSLAALLGCTLLLPALQRNRRGPTTVYPSASVLRSSVTLMLAGGYLVVAGMFAKIATRLGGDAAFALKTFLVLVSAVLLAVLLQSDRAKLNIRRFVSRHFQRPLYDYRVVWQRFTDATATCVEPSQLGRAVVTHTADILQALSVSIWIADQKAAGFSLGASTALTLRPDDEPIDATEARVLADALQRLPEPVDIETIEVPWATTLRRLQPSQFLTGGHRVCVPLRRGNRLVGLILVGDRVGGLPFLIEEIELLKGIADHATAGLLNLHLAQQLLHAKQLEAFQTMATFFVHDLKNAASTLNLTLQNLPIHFDDPEFRQDALRGIEKTANHIGRLVGRLSALRHELDLHPVPADLNAFIQRVLLRLERESGIQIAKALAPLPAVAFDAEQLEKVVTNLLLNAREAGLPDAEIRVATAVAEGGVVLSVADDGCGMSPEFLRHSLFRPFQTTKKTGLGIGMFQSRMIVEAHGGEITAISAPARGTTFRVFLPNRN